MYIKKNNLSLAEKKQKYEEAIIRKQELKYVDPELYNKRLQMNCENQRKNNKRFKEIIEYNAKYGLSDHVIMLKRCFITCEDVDCNITATEFMKCEMCPGLDVYKNNLKAYSERKEFCNNTEVI